METVPENKYMDMSLDELIKIKITSVSKSEEKLSDAATAIYVITQEDIRRSGATSIPEVLRMAPGIQVAHIDANKWAITSRGFNGRYANKLLVLQDGRTVYTPLYSGVYWDVQDTMLEDIDRIEIIRGPGATLWGSNAVNGVINIITSDAAESQGKLISGGAGSQERGFGQARHGSRMGDITYRIYGKSFYRASYPYGKISEEDSRGMLKAGEDAADQWSMTRGGFRADWRPSKYDHATLQGDIYGGYENTTINFADNPSMGIFNDKSNVNGGNIIARWKHSLGQNTDFALQVYYDRTERNQFEYHVKRNTYDLDIQQTFPLPWRQKMIVGFGYRYSSDNMDSPEQLLLDPEDKILHWISGFVQDEITVIPDKLRLIFGSKFENNDYTGFEIQPSARILWKPVESQTLWAAVSRAVRTPSRADENLDVTVMDIPATPPATPGYLVTMNGNDEFRSEVLIAYELGYRLMPFDTLSLDITTFLNDYDHLRTLEPQSMSFDMQSMQFLKPYMFENDESGRTYGLEAAATLKLSRSWTVYASYSWLNYNLGAKAGSENILPSPSEWSPRQQFSMRSYLDLAYNLELDSALYYVDGLEGYDVPAYTRLDLRLGWKPVERVDISLMIENLLDDQHPEFGGIYEGIISTEVPRSFYGKITVRF